MAVVLAIQHWRPYYWGGSSWFLLIRSLSDRIQFSNLTTISNETVENRENNCLLFLKVQLEFKWDLIVKYNGIVREIKMAESIN
jgi:hypothetical protein